MIWPWYAFIAAVGVPVAVLAIAFVTDRDGWYDAFMWIGGILAVPALFFLLMSLIISIGRSADRVSCRQFATASGYETKFVIYRTTHWDCLVRTTTGRWIPKDSLIGTAKS